jgi:hypothetical protein
MGGSIARTGCTVTKRAGVTEGARVAEVTHVVKADYRVEYGEPDSSLQELQGQQYPRR